MAHVRIIGLLMTAVLIAGCATTRTRNRSQAESLLPEIDIVQVKENADEALRLAQETKMDMEVANTKMTEVDNKLLLLNEEVSSVSVAKIEELENRLSLLVEALRDIQAQLDALQTSPQVRAVARGKPGQATFSPSSASNILNPSPEYQAYQNALRSFNARNYKEAQGLFEDVLKQFPQGKYADNCQYWIGECYYATDDFAQAVAAFQKVSGYANSSKADDAEMKLGLSYMRMGQKSLAKAELQKLIDRYPGSEYVPRAKKAIEEMK